MTPACLSPLGVFMVNVNTDYFNILILFFIEMTEYCYQNTC